MRKRKIVVAVTGDTGSSFARRLLDRLEELSDHWEAVGTVFSKSAELAWEREQTDREVKNYPFENYALKNWHAPFASGSARYDTLIVCPCDMGIAGRINAGISDDLISRAADVVLKERRQLILVPHETPWSLVHLRNFTALAEAGAIVCPALGEEVIERILELTGLPS